MNETMAAALRYPCPMAGCDRRFADERLRGDHLREVHGKRAGSVIYTCRRPDCDQTFDTKARRDGHEDVGHRKRAPEPIGCPSRCGKTFITELQRDAHVRVAHPNVRVAGTLPGSTDPAPDVAAAERASDRAVAAALTTPAPEPLGAAETKEEQMADERCWCGRPVRHRGMHKGQQAKRGAKNAPGPNTGQEEKPGDPREKLKSTHNIVPIRGPKPGRDQDAVMVTVLFDLADLEHLCEVLGEMPFGGDSESTVAAASGDPRVRAHQIVSDALARFHTGDSA